MIGQRVVSSLSLAAASNTEKLKKIQGESLNQIISKCATNLRCKTLQTKYKEFPVVFFQEPHFPSFPFSASRTFFSWEMTPSSLSLPGVFSPCNYGGGGD